MSEKKWKELYEAAIKDNERLRLRVSDLEDMLRIQIRSNDKVGEKMEQQDHLMQDRFNEHNKEMQGMAAEIMQLRTKVRELGGNLS